MVNTLPVRSIVGAVDRAAAVWRDASSDSRRRARKAAVDRTGYSPAVVDYALDRLFAQTHREALESIINYELGSLDVLDGFVAQAGRRLRALPAGNVCIISSRTTIGVALWPLIFALCAKCRVLVKDREDKLIAAFLQTLFDAEPRLVDVAAATAWRGDRDAIDLNSFDVVVAFGSDPTLQTISAATLFPARLIGYPSRTSAGYLSQATLRDETVCKSVAAAAARDALLYDGEGCLSLHLLFVQRGSGVGDDRFTEILRSALEAAAESERAFASAPELAASRALGREAALFRAGIGDRAVIGAESSYLLRVCDFAAPPSLLPRSLDVVFVDEASEALSYLHRHHIAVEALAAQPNEAVAELAAATGAARITRFGSLQDPPLAGFHGGRARIAEFVRWIVDER